MMNVKRYDKVGPVIFQLATRLTIAVETIGLAVFFYLATFIRYIADDFCEIALIRQGPLLSVIYENYSGGAYRSTNRFAKLFFVDLSQLLGRYDAQLLPIVMILLWILSLIWIFHEVKKILGIQLPFYVNVFMSFTLVFFTILQAPNMFQIFFWRSSSLTHFAPVVFYLLMTGFILSQACSANGKSPAAWSCLFVFIASFVIGGAGETPTVLMFAVHALMMFYFWRHPGEERRSALILGMCGLLGMFVAVCGMFLAPSNFSHGETSLLILGQTVLNSLKYTYLFIWDTFQTLPLPSLVSFLLPALLFFCLYTQPGQQTLLPAQKRQLAVTLLLALLLGYMLIMVAFIPGTFGQTYPGPRIRFSARFVMTAALIIEGGLLGAWVAQFKPALSYRNLLFPTAAFVLLIVGFYPLRGGLWLWNHIESYRNWSAAWDARDRAIRQAIQNGTTDMETEPLEPIGDVGDIKLDTEAWMNRCTADYYGLESIRSR
jgi:hypothetical protein